MTDLLASHDVGFSYRNLRALDGVTIEFSHGVVGILGVNGAGKSTLLKIFSGALRPSQGRITIGGSDPYERCSRKVALSHVALVPQAFDFPQRYRLGEFLDYMAWMRAVPRTKTKERVAAAAEAVNLSDRMSSRLGEMSGGMLRRAAIAQGLLSEPRTLILDEPTAGLDPQQRATVRNVVSQIAAERSVILATHIVEDIEYTASRVAVLDGGRIVYDGTVEGLRSPESDGASSLEAGFLKLIGAQDAAG
jgi:ABC-2 type transport system ATP-binding protein